MKKMLQFLQVLLVGVVMIESESWGAARADVEEIRQAFANNMIDWTDYCSLMRGVGAEPNRPVTREELDMSMAMYESEKEQREKVTREDLEMSRAMYESEKEQKEYEAKKRIEDLNTRIAELESKKAEEERKRRAKEREEIEIARWESKITQMEEEELARGITGRVDGYGYVNLEDQRKILEQCERHKEETRIEKELQEQIRRKEEEERRFINEGKH